MAHRLPPAGSLEPPPSDFFAFYVVHPASEREPKRCHWPKPEPVLTSCHLRPKCIMVQQQRSECCCRNKKSGNFDDRRHHVRSGSCQPPQKTHQCGLCLYPSDSVQSKHNRYGLCVVPADKEECHEESHRHCHCNKGTGKKCSHGEDVDKKPCETKVTTRRRRETVTTVESVTSCSGCRNGKRRELVTCSQCAL